MSPPKPKRTAIDLFSGCGGLSLGLRRAGFKVLAALDNDSLSVATYRFNHKQTLMVENDIRSVDADVLRKRIGLRRGELDLLAGCPPCQGFSKLRTLNGRHHIKDPMNDLVFEFLRFVYAFQPKALMMENVPTLLNDVRMTRIKNELDRLMYKYDARILNAAEFGVPQRRQRMVLLGLRESFPMFAPALRCHRTVAHAIRNLPPKTMSDPAHNYAVRRTARVMSMIRQVPKNGGSRTDLPAKYQLECHRDFNGFKDIYGRMAWNAPAPTITGGCINPSRGRFLHPEEDRAITLREAATLQSFPHSYRFDLSKGFYSAAQMIGNAFPPKFAEHHAKSIHKQLDINSMPKRRDSQLKSLKNRDGSDS